MEYEEVLIKLRKIIRSVNLESKKIEKEFGVSIPQLLVLQYLSKQEDFQAFAKDIKTYINLNASTVSGIISRLGTKGLIARIPKPEDKRATNVVLTAKGMELLQRSPMTFQEKVSRRLKNLTPEQIAELDRNIELLTVIMDVEDVDAAPIITNKELS